MAGYAIECAIKACIAKDMGQYPFPAYIKENDLRQKYYTHDLLALVESAGLKDILRSDRVANQTFNLYWKIVTDWSEEARYITNITRQQAENIIQAIEDPVEGVLLWLKKHW